MATVCLSFNHTILLSIILLYLCLCVSCHGLEIWTIENVNNGQKDKKKKLVSQHYPEINLQGEGVFLFIQEIVTNETCQDII